jgi:hypothetical protein
VLGSNAPLLVIPLMKIVDKRITSATAAFGALEFFFAGKYLSEVYKVSNFAYFT